jgi:hypothetical protein
MSEIVVDYTPAERVDEDDMPWEQFEGRLAAVLGRMAAGTFLILSSRADDEVVYYVQFAQGGRGGFRAEAESNNFLAGRWALSPAQEEQLAQLGWQCPTPGDRDLNYMRSARRTGSSGRPSSYIGGSRSTGQILASQSWDFNPRDQRPRKVVGSGRLQRSWH